MKNLLILTALLFTASCVEPIVYSDINRTLIILKKSDEPVKEVVVRELSLEVVKHNEYTLLATSKTYNLSFRREDLIAKAKELGASQIIISDKYECAVRGMWGEFNGCWKYDIIYFAK